jgi:hypothetical protein
LGQGITPWRLLTVTWVKSPDAADGDTPAWEILPHRIAKAVRDHVFCRVLPKHRVCDECADLVMGDHTDPPELLYYDMKHELAKPLTRTNTSGRLVRSTERVSLLHSIRNFLGSANAESMHLLYSRALELQAKGWVSRVTRHAKTSKHLS